MKSSRREKPLRFVLQGRLGNQIWGLSEAHRLHNISEEKVEVILSDVDFESSDNDLLNFMALQDWLTIQKRTSSVRSEIEDAVEVSVNVKLQLDQGRRTFRGFVPSYEMLVASGLYQEGKYPFAEPPHSKVDFVSVGIRRRDYFQNPHLGILPRNYYTKALSNLEKKLDDVHLAIFGDEDPKNMRKLIPREYWSRILNLGQGVNPLLDLGLMSRARFSIISNSTLSYLGAFFSKSEVVFLPTPFYLKIEGWNELLKNQRTVEVLYTKSTDTRYFILRARKRLRKLKPRNRVSVNS